MGPRAPGDGYLVLWAGSGPAVQPLQEALEKLRVRSESCTENELVAQTDVRAPDLVVLPPPVAARADSIASEFRARTPACAVPLIALGAKGEAREKPRSRFGLIARFDVAEAPDSLAPKLFSLLDALSKRNPTFKASAPLDGLPKLVDRFGQTGRTGLLVVSGAGALAMAGKKRVAPTLEEWVGRVRAAGGGPTVPLALHERPADRIGVITPDDAEGESTDVAGARVLMTAPFGGLDAALQARGADVRMVSSSELKGLRTTDPTVLVVAAESLLGDGLAALWEDPRLAAGGLLVVVDAPRVSKDALIAAVAELCAPELALVAALREQKKVAGRIESIGTARWLKVVARCEHAVSFRVFSAAGRVRVDMSEGRLRGATLHPHDGSEERKEGKAALDSVLGILSGRVLAGPTGTLGEFEGRKERRKLSAVGMMSPTSVTEATSEPPPAIAPPPAAKPFKAPAAPLPPASLPKSGGLPAPRAGLAPSPRRSPSRSFPKPGGPEEAPERGLPAGLAATRDEVAPLAPDPAADALPGPPKGLESAFGAPRAQARDAEPSPTPPSGASAPKAPDDDFFPEGPSLPKGLGLGPSPGADAPRPSFPREGSGLLAALPRGFGATDPPQASREAPPFTTSRLDLDSRSAQLPPPDELLNAHAKGLQSLDDPSLDETIEDDSGSEGIADAPTGVFAQPEPELSPEAEPDLSADDGPVPAPPSRYGFSEPVPNPPLLPEPSLDLGRDSVPSLTELGDAAAVPVPPKLPTDLESLDGDILKETAGPVFRPAAEEPVREPSADALDSELSGLLIADDLAQLASQPPPAATGSLPPPVPPAANSDLPPPDASATPAPVPAPEPSSGGGGRKMVVIALAALALIALLGGGGFAVYSLGLVPGLGDEGATQTTINGPPEVDPMEVPVPTPPEPVQTQRDDPEEGVNTGAADPAVEPPEGDGDLGNEGDQGDPAEGDPAEADPGEGDPGEGDPANEGDPVAADASARDLLEQARLAQEAQEFERAEALSREAMERSPRNAYGAYRLGVALYRQREMGEALTWAQRANEWNSQDSATHTLLGNIYLFRGRYRRAAAEFNRALELTPDYGPAQRQLALMRRRNVLPE